MQKFAALVAIALLSAGCSQSATSGSSMSTVGYAFAPPAANTFCARQPGLCSTAGKTKVMALTEARMRDLKRVNASVNQRIQQREDIATTGRDDDWRLPTSVGDCEDIAILKKNELRKLGWPASTLLLTVATYGGTGHTVLTVRTDSGDLILDNRTGAIRNWKSTPYRYFARQSQSESGRWTRIGA
ncbi:transglutaminase-like cysteine peptidase [Aminobacter anthyllidis]|uniref:Transglutaminase-like cysteine peptidase n=1 Tax=Aminobacter anthyllidis TaxID=1035067 RepID=A0A9X1AFF4_9HYPH|nr:transglutaminase-like cysteine peptidase [Aminobacter anthyllidis]MBT1158847.1 transglutaminase-like cysteine peptidase [Aminobacter anthyllidis]